MPIWIDIANLVVTKEALQAKYPGGIDGLRSDLRFDPVNKADQEDDELVSFGAMQVESLFGRLEALRSAGLRCDEALPAENDMFLVQRYGGASPQTGLAAHQQPVRVARVLRASAAGIGGRHREAGRG
ncbi:MAG TPA: hypothetical protein PKJ19_12065 [Flavobacteriales bacterium]|nr:hypothetical protein [Flavobacteriales bacterium]HNU55941.1 hypothetical protein [Flavobacteriales bacterium]